MSEKIVSAHTAANTFVVEGFCPMPNPYEQVAGLIVHGQTFWDERSDNGLYHAPNIRLPAHAEESPPPSEMGEVRRVRKSTLEPDAVAPEDSKLASQAFTDVLSLIPKEVPFTKLTDRLKQGNLSAMRPATYTEALYALELARFVTADVFQHRIACYELSLTAALYCHAKQLAVSWCLGVSLCDKAIPHAWVEAEGQPVRGKADEVIAGAYRKLFHI